MSSHTSLNRDSRSCPTVRENPGWWCFRKQLIAGGVKKPPPLGGLCHRPRDSFKNSRATIHPDFPTFSSSTNIGITSSTYGRRCSSALGGRGGRRPQQLAPAGALGNRTPLAGSYSTGPPCVSEPHLIDRSSDIVRIQMSTVPGIKWHRLNHKNILRIELIAVRFRVAPVTSSSGR